MAELIFILGDKLPWISEAVLAIIKYAPGSSLKKEKETKQRKLAINAYVTSLIEIWSKAFGSENVLERKAVSNKIRNALSVYFNKVLCNRRSQTTKRERLNEWRWSPEANQLLDILNKGCKPDEFAADEKKFYYEQTKETRFGYLSEHVDFEYEEEKELQRKENEFREKEVRVVEQICEEMEIETEELTLLSTQ